MTTFTTKRDLRNWVDIATSGWGERGDTDVDTITDRIQADPKRPNWGTDDWTDYLTTLDLTALAA